MHIVPYVKTELHYLHASLCVNESLSCPRRAFRHWLTRCLLKAKVTVRSQNMVKYANSLATL